MTLLLRSPIEPQRRKDTKTLQSLPVSHSGQSAPGCIDHELGLLDLADALLRNAPQAYMQQAYAGTLAHVNRCPTCRADLVDLVLTTLHYEAHLPGPAGPDPTEEGPHHDA